MNIEWTPALRQRTERDISRGLKFLRAASSSLPIRRSLARWGYTREIHGQGFELLVELIGYKQPWDLEPHEPPAPQRSALAALEEWCQKGLKPARIAIEHLHPEQGRYLFASWPKVRGGYSFLKVQLFLERLRLLDLGLDPYRGGSREADRLVRKTLEERDILSEEEESRLRALLAGLTGLPTEVVEEPEPFDGFLGDDEGYLELAGRFHAWITAWRETARAVISDRRHLIRLGLVKLKRKKRVS